MIRILKAALLIAATFAAVCFGLLLLQLRITAAAFEKTAAEFEQTAIAATSLVQETHGRIVGTSQNLNAILIQAGLATDEVRRASLQQRIYWNQSGAEMVTLLKDAHTAVGALRAVTVNVDRNTSRLANSTTTALSEIPPTLQASQRTLDQATKTLHDASLILESNQITQTLANVQQATANVSHSTAAVDVWVVRATKPTSVLKTILEKAIGIGGSLAQMIK